MASKFFFFPSETCLYIREVKAELLDVGSGEAGGVWPGIPSLAVPASFLPHLLTTDWGDRVPSLAPELMEEERVGISAFSG